MKSPPIKNADAAAPAVIERLTYNSREAAAALGVSKITLWRMAQRGDLLPIPGLRKKLYSVAALRRFAEQGAA
ncbi:MAG TPA: helix-turn-helix domain-containing protein [Lacunisphaera sp.]|nr:helix-turn-helix domain-containing protein [Lacunisphaera sp.]